MGRFWWGTVAWREGGCGCGEALLKKAVLVVQHSASPLCRAVCLINRGRGGGGRLWCGRVDGEGSGPGGWVGAEEVAAGWVFWRGRGNLLLGTLTAGFLDRVCVWGA